MGVVVGNHFPSGFSSLRDSVSVNNFRNFCHIFIDFGPGFVCMGHSSSVCILADTLHMYACSVMFVPEADVMSDNVVARKNILHLLALMISVFVSDEHALSIRYSSCSHLFDMLLCAVSRIVNSESFRKSLRVLIHFSLSNCGKYVVVSRSTDCDIPAIRCAHDSRSNNFFPAFVLFLIDWSIWQIFAVPCSEYKFLKPSPPHSLLA